jgi:hypothetical protein
MKSWRPETFSSGDRKLWTCQSALPLLATKSAPHRVLLISLLLVTWVAIQTRIIGFRHWSQSIWWTFVLITIVATRLVRQRTARGTTSTRPPTLSLPYPLSYMGTFTLAVLPGTTDIGVMHHTDLLMAIIPPFLDAPMLRDR